MGAVEVMPSVLAQEPEAWALRINARWRQSRENIIETGQLLIDAKAACPHGGFENEVVTRLQFSPTVATRLMAIARDPRMTNPAHVQLLPPSWGTLYELTKLSDEEFDRGVQEHIIRPDMERKDVAEIRPIPHREQPETSSGEAKGQPLTPAGSKTADGLARNASDGGVESGHAFEGEVGTPVTDLARQNPTRAGVAPGPSETQMPGGGLAIAHSRIEPTDSRDFFPTPPWATRALFKHVLPHLRRDGHCKLQTAWEPACGEGHMAEVMRDYFREVRATDIEDYRYGEAVIDFLHPETRWFPDWIVTNPPFNDSADFVLKAIELAGTGVAMFVRLAWLESVGRYERIFRDHPPSQLAIFSERVPLHKGRWLEDGATMTAYIWLVWIKGMEPQAPFWIPPGCRDALTQPDDAARFTQSPVQKREAAPAAEAAE